ncbi:Rieske (2Fe-2S) protein [Enemella evansiae]|uniref:Rieske (2Fe-2S) protein n=1 Tax=Enemella evansiae TaxID=2016499 RepID=UPI000B965F93|nr:Rieske (2Fe-2S) protein [Enemella evansiae]PFG68612.1 nitrite reductase/ring-hydroxylating ferredoxin subunit [Propionibacteriaceae bacterium ES.041]OYN94092.1 nitrite reductase [Enemella evansiae]OYN95374.1 nitrite reductase [Enemella evansiae]OYO03481.1 nitrite reductase [Enemella evansiae]OYO09905.1 nitrite reductase [Enemella evansiae]
MTAISPNRLKVAQSDELPEGGRIVVDIGATTIGVFRTKNKLYAYRNTCPHQGGPVCQGLLIPRVVENLDDQKRAMGMSYDEDQLHIVCPWHGAEYVVATGEHVSVPRMKLSAFPVHEENGEIFVEI